MMLIKTNQCGEVRRAVQGGNPCDRRERGCPLTSPGDKGVGRMQSAASIGVSYLMTAKFIGSIGIAVERRRLPQPADCIRSTL
jgi:hypothetical protein